MDKIIETLLLLQNIYFTKKLVLKEFNKKAKTLCLLNALEPGTVLPVHRHMHTAETYVLLRGRIRVVFYNDLGAEMESFLLDPQKGNYGVHIPEGQWHTLEMMESAVILEVKDGPYIPLQPEDLLY